MFPHAHRADTLRHGARRMAAELFRVLPVDVAKERANNIAQALALVDADPIECVRDALADHLEPGITQALTIARVASAWIVAVELEGAACVRECDCCGSPVRSEVQLSPTVLCDRCEAGAEASPLYF